jgi:hypothetical protein
MSGAVAFPISSQAGANYTVIATDYTIVLTHSGANVTLPTTGVQTGRTLIIVEQLAAGTITSYTNNQGAASTTLARGSTWLQWTGTAWQQIN